jgi:hypothetical protein
VIARRQQEFSATIITEFGRRWASACAVLDTLRAEAASLAAALNCDVPTPPPFQIVHSVAHDRPEIRPRPLAPADPISVALPPELVRVKAVADRLNKARGLCSSVQRCKQWSLRHFVMAQQRGEPTEYRGTYAVQQRFTNSLDQLPFELGELVDRSLLSDGFLGRLLTGHTLRPIELVEVAV